MQLQRLAAGCVGKNTRLQLGDERRVAGQYSELAAQTGSSHRVNGFREHATLGCHYFELEFLSHDLVGQAFLPVISCGSELIVRTLRTGRNACPTFTALSWRLF